MGSARTTIGWKERTWNPVRGCSRVSEGCRNCYAEHEAWRWNGRGLPYEGLIHMVGESPQWTGEVRVVEWELEAPLSWRKPSMVFVNSMGDLFHESVSIETLRAVWWTMARAGRHVFQVLTKRARRAEWLVPMLNAYVDGRWSMLAESGPHAQDHPYVPPVLPNVWVGVSVENQEAARQRLPYLSRTPARVRFVSFEPLLESLAPAAEAGCFDCHACHCGYLPAEGEDGSRAVCPTCKGTGSCFDWAVVGGESGPGARRCYLPWVREVVTWCRVAAEVPVFVKQLGSNAWDCDRQDLFSAAEPPKPAWRVKARGKGEDMGEWPAELRVREMPRRDA